MNEDESIKFINSLVRNLQSLCHASVEFKQKIEVIGHIYLNVDSDVKFDYIVNEKVCRNEQDSTTFVSNSFHAGPKKTLAERKKELEEELAKLQQEQAQQLSAQLQKFHQNQNRANAHRAHTKSSQAYQNPNPLSQQIALKRQASRESLPTDRSSDFYQSQFKFPKMFYDDTDTDSGGMKEKQLEESNVKERNHDSTSKATQPPIDISSIKREYISQQEESSTCIFDRGRKDNDEMNNQRSMGTNETVFPGMTSHSYNTVPLPYGTPNSHTTSPAASNLGSPYSSPFIGSPPSSSQLSSPGGGGDKTRIKMLRSDKSEGNLCPVCLKTFVQRCSLYRHLRTVHAPVEVHQCTLCDFKTNLKLNYQHHMNTQHPEVVMDSGGT